MYLTTRMYLCASEIYLLTIFFNMWIFFYIYIQRYMFLCKLKKYFCRESSFIYKSQNTFVNPSVCICINIETDLTP